MNLLEFKRRLMTDPGERSFQMREACAAGDEFAEAAQESDRFEAALQRALKVPTPNALGESVILRQSLETELHARLWPRLTAVAAALALAVALTTFMLLPKNSSVDLQQHIARHWQYDG